MEKSLLLSKTFWFGIITAALPLWPAAAEWMTNNVAVFTGVWGALTVVLRMVTKEKVILLP